MHGVASVTRAAKVLFAVGSYAAVVQFGAVYNTYISLIVVTLAILP